MSIYEIIENNNIHSDRYAMAAISCIFKAFGDPIRSKEFWPWGDKVQCPWTITKGTEKDIDDAELLLERARLRYIEENSDPVQINDKTDTMTNSFSDQIKDLQNRINKLRLNTKKVNKASQNTIDVSKETQDSIDKLTN